MMTQFDLIVWYWIFETVSIFDKDFVQQLIVLEMIINDNIFLYKVLSRWKRNIQINETHLNLHLSEFSFIVILLFLMWILS